MFLLKKFIAAFLMPLPIFMILMFIGLYLLYKKKSRQAVTLITASFLWISLLSYAPFSALLALPLESSYSAVDLDGIDAEYIHVLGTAHVANHLIPISSQLDTKGLVRLNEGVLIYKQNSGMKLIFSGYGKDEPVSNAKKSAMIAVALGVDRDDIILLEEPRDTAEEAKALKGFIKEERVVLVTSATHMVRAAALFRKAGIDVIPAPTDFKVKREDDLLEFPSAEGLSRSESAFHEYIGLLWSKLRGDI
ncbi:MAG: ElyC/SanA/YdcF family protein [Campylobacterota bacterium]|nr:ElyC/SanA/YdcF family protein [Campylobacterota bacterium]